MKKIQLVILLLVMMVNAFGQDDLRLMNQNNLGYLYKSLIGNSVAISIYVPSNLSATPSFKINIINKNNGQLIREIDTAANVTPVNSFLANDKYIVMPMNNGNVNVLNINDGSLRTYAYVLPPANIGGSNVFGNYFYYYVNTSANNYAYVKVDLDTFSNTFSGSWQDNSGTPFNTPFLFGGNIASIKITTTLMVFSNGFNNAPVIYDLVNFAPWILTDPGFSRYRIFGVDNKIFMIDPRSSNITTLDSSYSAHNYTYNRDYLLNQMDESTLTSLFWGSVVGSENIMYLAGRYIAKVNSPTNQINFRKVDNLSVFGAGLLRGIPSDTIKSDEMILSVDYAFNINGKSVLIRGNTHINLTSNLPANDVTLSGFGAAPFENAREINAVATVGNKYFNRWVNALDNTTYSTVANIKDWYPIADVSLQAEFVDGFTAQILPSVGGSVTGFEGLAPVGTTKTYTATANAHYNFSYFEVTANGVVISQPNQAPFNVTPYSITPTSTYAIKGIFTEHPNKIITLTNENTTYQVNNQSVNSVKLYENDSVVISVTSTNGKTIVGLYDLDGNIYWGTNITFNYNNLPGSVLLYPLYPAEANKKVILEFNDQKFGTYVTSVTKFADTSISNNPNDPNNPIVPHVNLTANEANKIAFVYNSFGGSALEFKSIANSDFYLKGPSLYAFSDKFAFESHIKLSEPANGEIYLLSDDLCTCFEFKILANGELSLHLHSNDDGEIDVVTNNANIQVGKWANIGLKVDLSKQTLNDIIGIYKDNVKLNVTINHFDNSFTTGTSILKRRARPVHILHFTNSKNFVVDNVLLYLNQSQTNIDGFPTNFKGGEKEVNVDPNASASIYIFKDFLTPIQNKLNADGVIPPGTQVIPDIAINQPGVFHGVFQFKLGLEVNKFDGAIIIDYFIKRPEDAVFKKIGQKSFSKTVVNGMWDTYFYWDSKKSAFDWTADDTKPYKATGPVQFKFELR